MTATTLKQGTGKELKRLFAMLTSSIGETLGSLVGREITVRPGEAELTPGDDFVGRLPRTFALARGALDKGFAGKHLLAMFEVPDAVAMAGLLMMTPDDVIAQRRTKGTLEGEDAEAFGELGNVLYSGFGNVLREQVGNIDVRMHDHGIVKPGVDVGGLVGDGELACFPFRMKVGEFAESAGYLCVDRATAEAWNKAPLEGIGGATAAPAADPAATAAVPRNAEEEALESIPAAPIQGTLAAFVAQPEVFRTLRRACRRVGLELRRHGRGEIPNPAAHKNEVVLLDVPSGEDRRFDWCRRLKELSDSTKVVVLIHQASRQRVMQAFLARADVILGFPCDEQQLTQKLAGLLPGAAPPQA